ncbi:AMP-binding protein [Streptomyces sp. NPDC019224]|uniref:phenylacetate--CoA ligase family protein n=1 Tax=Streptomyces sp. NPDC019224 TaxID=3154484 RepID=UPI003411D83D
MTTIDLRESVPADSAPHQPALTGEEVRDLVRRAAELPGLADRYRAVLADGAPALTDVPVLTKDDFRALLPDLFARARSVPGGAVVFGSGGTTAAPKLSLMPSSLFITEIAAHWRPLTSDDVLVNCNNGAELGSMYPFYNQLGHATGAVVIPLGALDPEQLDGWLDFLEERGATALGGTPSHLAQVLEHYEATGRRPGFRKLIWTGEAYSRRAAEAARRVLPEAEIHGVYGSTETWVIGHNGPSCPLDTFHLLPYQHIEIEDGAVLVTNTHPDCVNPILRYRLGDRGELTACPCGRTGPALRVLGRDDQQLKFRSILFTPEEVAEAAGSDPEVRDVQLALFEPGTPGERLELRVLLTPGADAAAAEERVRRQVIGRLYRIGFELGSVPGAFTVRAVPRLWSNSRTGKTPLVVRDPEE